MLEAEVDEITCTVLVEPEGHLCKQDFLALSERIDPLIKQFGTLNGILFHAAKFSGWEGFAAFVVHLKFVNDHQKLVKKVAICSESSLGNLVEKLAAHFVKAEIKVFPYDELNDAKQWIVL
jgi:hypothetical protein